MAAGLGFKDFQTGDVLTAADVDGYLMQGIWVFANAAARDAAVTSPQEGNCCYLKDTDAVQTYSGSAWVGFDDSNSIQNSIVDAKGDIVAASGNDTPARLAVGNNGETLVADSSTSTGLRYQSNFAAGKNLIINGDFNIWQRGTTFTSPSFDTYTADRWRNTNYNVAPTTYSITRQTFTPGTAPVSGYEGSFFFRSTLTTIGSNTVYDTCSQRIEGILDSGQSVTVSFWAKSDSSRTQSFYMAQNYGSGGSGDTDIVAETSFTTTSSWTRFTFTGSVVSATGKTIGTNPFAYTRIRQASASGSVLDVWGVQVEYGSVATAFQTATGTLQGELAACQRYYFRTTLGADAITPFQGAAYSTTAAYGIMNSKVTMRTIPTAVDYSNVRITDAITNYTITALALWSIRTEDALGLLATGASGLTQFRPYVLSATGSGGYVGLSAEL